MLQVGSSVYVSNLLSGTISVVDPTTGTVTATITLTGTLTPAPSGLAASGDGHHLYVDDVRNGTTIVLDLTTNPVTQDGTATVGTYPAASGGRRDHRLRRQREPGRSDARARSASSISATRAPPSTTHTVAVGSHPYGIAESPFLGEALVSNSGDGTMSVIDTTHQHHRRARR